MNIHTLYGFIFRYTRSRRMRLFARLFPEALAANSRIVDVGGYPLNWTYIDRVCRVVLVNLEFHEAPTPGFHYVIADGKQLPFRNKEFDIAYSNSVIEHVGTRQDQAVFAAELERVGRGCFVQTPNRWFPIEPHLLTPLIHYLPKGCQRRLIRRFSVWGLLTKPDRSGVDTFLAMTRLLSYHDFRGIFPNGNVVREKIGGFTKSLITVRTSLCGNAPSPAPSVLGMRVDYTSYTHASDLICQWSRERSSRYVCVAAVNNVMEAYDSPRFLRVMNDADLVTPDGMPVVWAMRLLGHKTATRVYGPDLTPLLLERAAGAGLSVGFFGAAPETLRRLLTVVAKDFPKLHVAYSCSPPFRSLTPEEDENVVADINRSGVRILFVGLNTPKQDYWMASHKGRIQAVMVGVGAAFDFLAGSKPQAPRWMMNVGLEWLFRLATEPRRLWKRYLKHNPRFVFLLALRLLGWKDRSLVPRTDS